MEPVSKAAFESPPPFHYSDLLPSQWPVSMAASEDVDPGPKMREQPMLLRAE